MEEKLQRLLRTLSPWRILRSQVKIQDRWLHLRADSCQDAHYNTIDPYYVIEGKSTVHIVALNEEQEILITSQYRHAASLISLEFPCGEIEEGEEPAEAARRELLEETGCTVSSLVFVGSFFANPARRTSQVYTFLGSGAAKVAQKNLDETEDIEHDFFSQDELKELIARGLFSQGLHIASWYQVLQLMASRR